MDSVAEAQTNSQERPTLASQPSRFLDLPAELRLKIYQECLVVARGDDAHNLNENLSLGSSTSCIWNIFPYWANCESVEPFLSTALLRVCKQIHEEAVHFMFTRNELIYSLWTDINSSELFQLRSKRPELLAGVTHLVLFVVRSCNNSPDNTKATCAALATMSKLCSVQIGLLVGLPDNWNDMLKAIWKDDDEVREILDKYAAEREALLHNHLIPILTALPEHVCVTFLDEKSTEQRVGRSNAICLPSKNVVAISEAMSPIHKNTFIESKEEAVQEQAEGPSET